MRSGSAGMLVAAIAAMGGVDVGGPPTEPEAQPRKPRTGRNGIRRGTVHPEGTREQQRRARQIARGIIRTTEDK